jgi:putative glutamine amidotransferase
MPGKPIIGLATALEQARWGAWQALAAVLPFDYAAAVQRAGGTALLIPPDPSAVADPDSILDAIDALVLIDGADLHPEIYGAEVHPETEPTSRLRDEVEIALAARAIERDLPFLGICRGMQVMNVARGGTLRQHVPEEVGHDDHRRAIGTFEGSDHDVRLADGSLAARAAGETLHAAKSHHHQAIARVGAGFEVTGWAAMDDLPEAIESPDHRYLLGVQWHPEADETSRLIASVVEEARAGLAAARRRAGGSRRGGSRPAWG